MICEKCKTEMVRYKENNIQGWKCPACGNGIYTSYFDEIDSDPTEYSLFINGTQDVTTEKIQYISKIANINFIEAKNILSKGNSSEIKTKAPMMKEIIIRLRELDIDYTVTPEFKYTEAKMIVDKKTEIQKLIDSSKLDSDEKIESFENAIQALSEKLSCDDVTCLCKAFCDDTQNEEVMFGLIHLVERLRGKDYLREIALCTPDMTDAHDWAMTLNKRILNSADYLDMYISVIDSLGESEKDKILSLLNDIKNDNPSRFAEKIDYLIGRIY